MQWFISENLNFSQAINYPRVHFESYKRCAKVGRLIHAFYLKHLSNSHTNEMTQPAQKIDEK